MSLFAEVCDLAPDDAARRLEEETDPGVRALVRSMLAADADDADIRLEPASAIDMLAVEADLADEPADALLPTEIDGHQVVGMLGEGGMGTVYDAVQSEPQRPIAIKVVRLDRATSSGLRRFEREAEVLGRLRHPSIATVYGVGRWTMPDGRTLPYLLMEKVDGVRLDEWASGRSDAERLSMLAEVADALQVIHRSGVVHGDVKPANILIDVDGRPRLVDFGVARFTDGPEVTETVGVGGTLAYAAPEQFDGATDTRADVFALGVVAWRILVGRLPVDPTGSSLLSYAARVRDVGIPPLGQVERRFRGDAEAVIACATATRPDDRYPAASAFAGDLRRLQDGLPVEARPLRGPIAVGRWVVRHRLAAVAVAAVVMVTVATMAVVTAAWREAEIERQRSTASLDFLERMMRAAAPAAPGEGPRTMREYLELAAGSLPGSLDASSEAGLREMIGRTYAALGDEDAAITQFRERIARLDEISGSSVDARRVRARVDLAAVLRESGRYDEARAAIDDAASFTVVRRDPLLAWLIDAGRAAQAAADGEDETAYAGWRALLDRAPEGAPVAEVAMDFAVGIAMAGRTAEALPLLERAIAAGESSGSPLDPLLRRAIEGRAGTLLALGRAEEAVAGFEDALARHQAVLGPEHPSIALTRGNLATALADAGQVGAAAEELESLLEFHARVDGPDAPLTMRTAVNLAGVLSDLGRRVEAVELARRVVDGRRRTLGAAHPSTANAVNSLARMLERGDGEEIAAARELYRELHRWATEDRGLRDRRAMIYAGNAAAFERTAGEPDRAVEIGEAVLEASRLHLPADQWDIAYFEGQLGLSLVAAGRAREGRERLTAALAGLERLLPEGHRQIIRIREAIADLDAE